MIISLLNRLRGLGRSTGIFSVLQPYVRKIEGRYLSRFGSYTARQLSEEQTEILGTSGRRVIVGPPPEFALMARSEHERPMIVSMLHWFAPLAEGKVVWDIGANVGFYSTVLSHFAGRQGKVVAFEPNPTTFAELSTNLKTAGCDNVMPVMIGLSDHDGKVAMEDTGHSTSCTLEVRNSSNAFFVHIAAGDTLVAEGQCPAPELVKMDIEGHEVKALEGMKTVLAAPACRLLLCEVHFSILEESGVKAPSAKIEFMLRAAGFTTLQWISRSHLVAQKDSI